MGRGGREREGWWWRVGDGRRGSGGGRGDGRGGGGGGGRGAVKVTRRALRALPRWDGESQGGRGSGEEQV